jgi:hypothetical protein
VRTPQPNNLRPFYADTKFFWKTASPDLHERVRNPQIDPIFENRAIYGTNCKKGNRRLIRILVVGGDVVVELG